MKSSFRKSKNNKNDKLSVKFGAPPKHKNLKEINKRPSFIIHNSNSKNMIMDLTTRDEKRKFGNSIKLLRHSIIKKDKDKKINKKLKFHDVMIFNDRTINSQQVSALKKSFPYSSNHLIKIRKKKKFSKKIKYINNVKILMIKN